MLHFECGQEVKEIEIDFIQTSELYCTGINKFTCIPIYSMHKNQSFPSLLIKNNNFLEELSTKKVIKRKLKKTEKKICGNEYLGKLKHLCKQMRVIISNKQIPKNEFIEGMRKQIDSLFSSSLLSGFLNNN